MNCSQCGAPNREGQKFCTNCGTPLITAARSSQAANDYSSNYTQDYSQGYSQEDPAYKRRSAASGTGNGQRPSGRRGGSTSRSPQLDGGSVLILKIVAGILAFICLIAVIRSLYVFPNFLYSFRVGIFGIIAAFIRLFIFICIVLLFGALVFFVIGYRGENVSGFFSLIAIPAVLIPLLYIVWMIFHFISCAVRGYHINWGSLLLRFLFPYLLGPVLILVVMFVLIAVLAGSPAPNGLSGIFSDAMGFFSAASSQMAQQQQAARAREAQMAQERAAREAAWQQQQANAGNYNEDGTPAGGGGGQYPPPGYRMPPMGAPGTIPPEYEPITMWGYFGYELLFCIPCVGFILLLVFAFGGTRNINLRNFARSYFCLLIVSLIITGILIAILAAAGGLSYMSYRY